MQTQRVIFFCLISLLYMATHHAQAQMITGVWTGKINRQKVEVKIIQRGDSLTGTSYYGTASQYSRYRIKGYFDAASNEVVWWDDQLLEQKPASSKGQMGLLSRADFNCPGDGRMMLDGKTGPTDNDPSGDVHLNKTDNTTFNDEWDFVIDNYMTGGNDPDVIDSIEALTPTLTATPPSLPKEKPVIAKPPVKTEMVMIPSRPAVVPALKTPSPPTPQTIEDKFSIRKKTLVTEIPVTGDSIELRFYDNAEIDGDSISLFLDGRLLYRNIRLTGNAYSIKLAVNSLDENSELVMVAENLGSIPPNTSLMIAVVGDNRYEARLESTEGSSAMVRFKKPPASAK
ncbi:hypothetical protein LZZ85_09665 [Terrimonas sp. NA20]|uniref:Uncharacterized protein n=1 Tax=Terrimonas ginsenosidimutans TaxID=2908004 RepID=A0ABS9KQH6_9BACT|nr:hypothetical protein [Terrimonas ginsenosidimutans]MCG2614549.1 hypothetical protein [Terrimonas ginsenosidimutans]